MTVNLHVREFVANTTFTAVRDIQELSRRRLNEYATDIFKRLVRWKYPISACHEPK